MTSTGSTSRSDIEHTSTIIWSSRREAVQQTVVGEVFNLFLYRLVILSYKVHVNVADDVHRFDNRRQAIENVRHLGEERGRHSGGPGSVNDGNNTRLRAEDDTDA